MFAYLTLFKELLFCWYKLLFCKCLLFQKALASYIKKYAYSNAKTEDLWAVLEEESGEPVKDLMTTWTKQQGYPVIYAKINGHDLELEQVCNGELSTCDKYSLLVFHFHFVCMCLSGSFCLVLVFCGIG